MYWTPAKILLLADVDEYSFANAEIVIKELIQFDPFITLSIYYKYN